MATVKVFDAEGCKILSCFDTLVDVPYEIDEEVIDDTPEEKNPFE